MPRESPDRISGWNAHGGSVRRREPPGAQTRTKGPSLNRKISEQTLVGVHQLTRDSSEPGGHDQRILPENRQPAADSDVPADPCFSAAIGAFRGDFGGHSPIQGLSRSDFDAQFFDLAVQAGKAQFQTFGRFALVGPLPHDATNVEALVVSQRGTQFVGVR